MDPEYWQQKLREAEAELDAARTRTALDAAAKNLQRAKGELMRLDQAAAERPEPSPGGPPRRRPGS